MKSYEKINNSSNHWSIVHETLIIHGKHDEVVPFETIEILERKIINNSLILYGNSGHSPMYEESARFNIDVIQYLNEK